MDLRGFTTSVSVEESDFLEEFMSCDFSSTRDKNNIGSLTDLRKASVFDIDLKMIFLHCSTFYSTFNVFNVRQGF